MLLVPAFDGLPLTAWGLPSHRKSATSSEREVGLGGKSLGLLKGPLSCEKVKKVFLVDVIWNFIGRQCVQHCVENWPLPSWKSVQSSRGKKKKAGLVTILVTTIRSQGGFSLPTSQNRLLFFLCHHLHHPWQGQVKERRALEHKS